jgi:hypothetical protein
MKVHRHIAQSIAGAVKNWDDSMWKSLAKDNKCTVSDVKDYFLNALAEGKKVIPIGEPCEGFSYITGCPGHDEGENINETGTQ